MKLTIFTFLTLLFSNPSQAGFPPFTDVNPNNISEGQEVYVGFDPLQSPCLQSITNFQGLTEGFVIDSNNFIDITIIALSTSPCLNIGVEDPPYRYYSLGQLPEGDYTVQMYWAGSSTPFPVPPNSTRIPIGDLLQFSVGSPTPVPTLSFWSLTLLLILLLGISYMAIHKNIIKSSAMIVLVLYSTFSFGKTFHIMLSSDQGAPSAEDVVNQASTSPSPPAWLLSSFNEASPSSVEFLLQERPTGNRLALVNSAPDWIMSKLYRYVVVSYPDSVDEENILTIFQNDVHIDKQTYVSDRPITVSAMPYVDGGKVRLPTNKPNTTGAGTNFLVDLNITSAWELSEGMGYIGALDTGIDIDHPDFETFDANDLYQGGNILDAAYYQVDVGNGDFNIDENEPFDTQGNSNLENCDLEDGVDDNLATSVFVGHGTHITGILAGSDNSIGGICKNCGMSMMKNASYTSSDGVIACVQYNGVFSLVPFFPHDKSNTSLEILTNSGVGTVNWSGGVGNPDLDFCADDQSDLCMTLELMKIRNTLLVTAAGNHREKLQFPASEVGTVAVGGLDEAGSFWNESPNNGDPFPPFVDTSNCPGSPRPLGEECGSNISHSPTGRKLDVMAQARTVYSTFYEGGQWADDINCTDFQDGSVDGYGNCTGTSMSAPQVAGILQLMRSAHPLLPNGTSDPEANIGLINILNATASQSTNGLGLNQNLGYGLPNARLALERILGKSNDQQMKTRLTPMFALVSSTDNNNVYTPFPQVAVSFLTKNGAAYTVDPSAAPVEEFTEFWYDTTNFSYPAPRAAFYVFTTNNNPFINLKNMVPLRRMVKQEPGLRDETYAISTSEINTFKSEGYGLAGIEGYIFPICELEPGCIPADAHKLYRVYDEVNINHTLVNLPINDPAPANSTKIGYVFPNIHSDNDGLIDGQERVLGTSKLLDDTDGDGLLDGIEYPAEGIPYSDPLISDIIFEDGFE